MVRLKITIF